MYRKTVHGYRESGEKNVDEADFDGKQIEIIEKKRSGAFESIQLLNSVRFFFQLQVEIAWESKF